MLSVVIILICVLLVLVILIQNSKGGGIQSQFGAATQIMGVKRGTEFIEKATWALAILLITFSIIGTPKSTILGENTNENNASATKKTAAESISVPQAPPPAAAPAQKTK